MVNGAGSPSRAPWPRNQASCCSTIRPAAWTPITATTVDDEVVKSRDVEHVTSIVVTHQIRDAFYVATHEAVRQGGRVRISGIPVEKATRATFLVLHEGRICFEGTAMELQASRDAYLREFLFMTLPPW